MDDTSSTSVTDQFKSFWQRTEGKVGKVIAAIGVVMVGLFLWSYHAQLVAMLYDTTKAVILLAVLGAILAVATSQEFRNAAGILFKVCMYKLTDWAVGIDPIATMRRYVEQLQKALAQMEEQIEMLAGQIRTLKEKIRRNVGQIQIALKTASEVRRQMGAVRPDETLKARQMRMAAILNQNAAVRKDRSNKTYEDLLADAQKLYDRVVQMRDGSMLLMEDMKGEVEELTERRKMTRSVMSILRSAMKIKGQTADKALYDRATEMLQEQYGQMVGAVENFANLNADFLAHSDIQNGIYEEEALKMLERMEAEHGGGLDSVINREPGIRASGQSAAPAQAAPKRKYDLFS